MLRCCMNFHTARVLNMAYKALLVSLITPTHRTLNIYITVEPP